MSYMRVIPQDLFNEAKLLKCLGQLALLIHDGRFGQPGLRFEHEDPAAGFLIRQDDSAGGLYCENLILTLDGRELHLVSHLNSKRPYPLQFGSYGECGDVFNDDGSPSEEFLQWLDNTTLEEE